MLQEEKEIGTENLLFDRRVECKQQSYAGNLVPEFWCSIWRLQFW